jgi:hypothetical protein
MVLKVLDNILVVYPVLETMVIEKLVYLIGIL